MAFDVGDSGPPLDLGRSPSMGRTGGVGPLRTAIAESSASPSKLLAPGTYAAQYRNRKELASSPTRAGMNDAEPVGFTNAPSTLSSVRQIKWRDASREPAEQARAGAGGHNTRSSSQHGPQRTPPARSTLSAYHGVPENVEQTYSAQENYGAQTSAADEYARGYPAGKRVDEMNEAERLAYARDMAVRHRR